MLYDMSHKSICLICMFNTHGKSLNERVTLGMLITLEGKGYIEEGVRGKFYRCVFE